MKEKLTDKKLIAYILGQLPEDEQLRLEEEIFAQDDEFVQLQILKEQVLDQYANNKLTPEQREYFEKQFLNSPWRRDRVAFAQALADHVSHLNAAAPAKAEIAKTETAKAEIANDEIVKISFWESIKGSSLIILLYSLFNFSDSPLRNASVAAIIVLLIAGASWLFFDNRHLKSQLAQLQQQQHIQPQDNRVEEKLAKELNRIKQLEEELAQARSQTTMTTNPDDKIKRNNNSNNPSSGILAFILNPQIVRSEGGIQKLQIPNQTQQVEMIVNFQSQNKTINAEIATVEGEKIWQSKVKPIDNKKSNSARIKLKASLLSENDYVLKLSEINSDTAEEETIAEYPFRVVKK